MTSRKKQRNAVQQARGRSPWGRSWGRIAGVVAAIVVGAGVWFSVSQRSDRPETVEPVEAGVDEAPVVTFELPPEEQVYSTYAGSASCRECHESEFGLWTGSNHALAERPPDPDLDRSAFDPARGFRHGTRSSEARLTNGQYQVVTPGFSNRYEPYPIVRAIGVTPLRQYMVAGARGRLQVLETAYDPHRGEWFDIYGEEDRRAGEWGHWTGRGMVWNSMCASCHNTRLRKNYEESTDSYRTTMAEMGVSCEACHGPLKKHVDWQRTDANSKEKDPTLPSFTKDQILDTCGSCHARRAELTGDFVPGDDFLDHYSLTIPDETELYYPDGQVRGENYVFGSFLSSGMHGAGVRCSDCHQAHSTQRLLPGNQLCMRCHNGSYEKSPIIEPISHSFHQVNSPGGQCVGCHMPQTTYMERHPRRDHGFTIPDPLLTKELGIPNACNRCHSEKDTDWALAAVEKWYGGRMERPTRERARWVAAARAGEEAARGHLLGMLNGEKSPYWQAVAAGLLDRWVFEPEVSAALTAALEHPEALVRAAAARSLGSAVQGGVVTVERALRRALRDPVRSVRSHTAWGLRHSVSPTTLAGSEMLHYLKNNADQPTGLLQKGLYHLSRQEIGQSVGYLEKAVEWDPNSAPLRHELAVILSMQGRGAEAVAQLEAACRLEPKEAEYVYKLGLAWNESGQIEKAIEALREAAQLNPRHSRALYNLGLALHSVEQPAQAMEALVRAESVEPNDPRIPYARATILAQSGQAAEARRAAERALEISPNYRPAAELLENLGP